MDNLNLIAALLPIEAAMRAMQRRDDEPANVVKDGLDSLYDAFGNGSDNMGDNLGDNDTE